eukprot:scaffold2179_cov72-Phaeocystis_antarctica.AAC.1
MMRKRLHGWRQPHQQRRKSTAKVMPTKAASDVAAVSPHCTHADWLKSKYRESSVTLQTLQYGPLVHGLQGTPFVFAHAVVSGEDASGQRLRSELLSFVRQYPGSKGSRAR